MQAEYDGAADSDRNFYSFLFYILAIATALCETDVVEVLGSQCPSVCLT
jgi:hypothetical protein